MDQNIHGWITQARAAELLGVRSKTLRELAESGALTVRRVPGAHPRYRLAEVEDLARRSTQPAAVG